MIKKTKKVKRKKLSIKKLILLLLILYLIISFFCYIFNLKIKNIYITGNKNIKDNEIIEVAKIKDYPSIFKSNSLLLKNRIKKISLVKNVKIKKSLRGKLTINIEEYKILYRKQNSDLVILDNGKSVKNDSILGVPTLISNLDNNLEKKLIKGLKKIDSDNLNLISEIEYTPLSSGNVKIDKERFLAYMNDGNKVYFNILNIENLNLYPKINSSLDNEKGYIYLDSSNSENFVFTPF